MTKSISKKILSAMMAALMVTAVGCGSDDDDDDSSRKSKKDKETTSVTTTATEAEELAAFAEKHGAYTARDYSALMSECTPTDIISLFDLMKNVAYDVKQYG